MLPHPAFSRKLQNLGEECSDSYTKKKTNFGSGPTTNQHYLSSTCGLNCPVGSVPPTVTHNGKSTVFIDDAAQSRFRGQKLTTAATASLLLDPPLALTTCQADNLASTDRPLRDALMLLCALRQYLGRLSRCLIVIGWPNNSGPRLDTLYGCARRWQRNKRHYGGAGLERRDNLHLRRGVVEGVGHRAV